MKKVFLFWLSFFVIIAILDLSLGALLKYTYKNQTNGAIGKTNHLVYNLEEDLLIMGSSKAEHGYDPFIFEEKTGFKTYNAGFAGKIISFHYALINLIPEKNKPKHIILDVTDKDFWDLGKNEVIDEVSSLAPYYGTSEIVDSLLLEKSSFEKIKLMSSLYPFNSELFSMLKQSDRLKKGLKISKSEWKYPLEGNTRNYTKMDQERIKFLEAFIKKCKIDHIKLTLVISPVFMISDGSEFDMLRKVANKNKIDLVDMYQEKLFLDHKEYFKDITHLNTKGAKIFSELLVEKLTYD